LTVTEEMTIGLLTLDLFIPGADSLKSKRYVMRSLKDRLKKFNVSVAEEANDLWQRSTLFIACVTTDSPHLYSTFENVKKIILSESSVEVLKMEMELL
jgi:uncharacterized protein YlxP (DUF503 family)